MSTPAPTVLPVVVALVAPVAPVAIALPRICLYMSTVHLDPVSAFIRHFSDCAESHAGFFDTATRQTLSAMCDGKGVAWRPLKAHQQIILLDAVGIDAAFAKMQTLLGDGYDIKQILGILLGKDWETPGKEICDYAVFWCFAETGGRLLNHDLYPMDHLVPRDLLLSEKLRPRADVPAVPVP